MRVPLILLIITFVPIIRSQYYDYYDYDYNYPRLYAGGDSSGTRRQSVNKRGVAEIVEKGVGLLSSKAKALVKLIRCLLQCFIKYFISNYCNRMFPCLYDCSIGQTFIAPDIEKQLDDSKSSLGYPASFQLANVFKVFKCLYDCTVERTIKNWETFTAALYCVADTCICFNVFGSGMKNN